MWLGKTRLSQLAANESAGFRVKPAFLQGACDEYFPLDGERLDRAQSGFLCCDAFQTIRGSTSPVVHKRDAVICASAAPSVLRLRALAGLGVGGAPLGRNLQQFRNGVRHWVFPCRDGNLGKDKLCGRLCSGDGCMAMFLGWMTMLLIQAIGL